MVIELGKDGFDDALRFVHLIEATNWSESPPIQPSEPRRRTTSPMVAMRVRATFYQCIRTRLLLLEMAQPRAVDLLGTSRCFAIFRRLRV